MFNDCRRLDHFQNLWWPHSVCIILLQLSIGAARGLTMLYCVESRCIYAWNGTITSYIPATWPSSMFLLPKLLYIVRRFYLLISYVDKIKIIPCISIVMIPVDFLEKFYLFFNNFGKSVVLSLHYQLLFLQSGRFPGKIDWTVVQMDIAGLSSYLEVWNPFQKVRTCTGSFHGILKCNRKSCNVDVIDSFLKHVST